MAYMFHTFREPFQKALRIILIDELALSKVRFASGVHPKDDPLFQSHQLELATLIKKPKMMKMGECR